MRNWTKNLSRAAVVAAGAVTFGSGGFVALAAADVADPHGRLDGHIESEVANDARTFTSKRNSIDVDQTQSQPGGAAGASFHWDDEDDHDDDDDGFLGLWGGSTGPISAYGGALAMVNITKSFSYGGGGYCSRCENDPDDSYAHKAKPKKKVKKYKAKPRKVKSYKAKAKPRKARSHKARSHRAKAHWSRPVKLYSYSRPLPSTKRQALARPRPGKSGEGRLGGVVGRLMKPAAKLRGTAKRTDQGQQQDVAVRSMSDEKFNPYAAKALQ
ncbi:hypothetical protein Acsp04_03840 [Actinomadura sp. NBRC 104425]|uniref:hypothetical protein n=1 Tax=Actinomadura sp. NBRC 104425 TaxID=3032204 RepID=UPI0024A4105B|nr:hypothetical protein [Actinomadura sp. NBRC 104425]GLZ10149.1 hypothetical protein Acsp04_03840 [Actinomadura sp. NBRC 104425]